MNGKPYYYFWKIIFNNVQRREKPRERERDEFLKPPLAMAVVIVVVGALS